jgi:hypothetical protein
LSSLPIDTENSKSVNKSPPKTESKNISVYLGDNRQKFESLKRFYPEMTIPNIVNTTVENYISSNEILLDDSLETRMSKNIELGIQFLEKCDKWTLENVEKGGKSFYDRLVGSEYLVVKVGPQLLKNLPPKNKQNLVLSLCEILFISDQEMRECFTERMKKHDSHCDVPDNYWDNLQLEFPEYVDMTLQEFIEKGADVPLINPQSLQSKSTFLETTNTLDELLEPFYPHDDQIIWCICLLDALADYLNMQSGYDESLKVIDSEKNVKDIISSVLEFYKSHKDFKYTDPILEIHTDGRLVRDGRSFIYPVHITEIEDYE